MQERVYQTAIHDVNDLKQRLLEVWHCGRLRIRGLSTMLLLNGLSAASRLACKQQEDMLNTFFNLSSNC